MLAEVNQTEEFTSLSKQHEAKRFYVFCHHVFHIKHQLMCSICLEVYNSPTELTDCKHVFCKDCIVDCWEYSKPKSTCPVCQKAFQKNHIKEHLFFKKLSEFIRNALKHIYLVLGGECNKLPSYVQVHQLWAENSHLTEIFNNIKNIIESPVTAIKGSAVLNNHKIVIEANQKFYSNSSTAKEDPFDVLLMTPTANTFFKKPRPSASKVYHAKRSEKEYTKPRNTGTVLQFENESHRTDILHWLEDSNNRFDCKVFTQTQQIVPDIPDFDMPSASQAVNFMNPKFNSTNSTELKRQKDMQNESRVKSNMLVRLSRPVQFVSNKVERPEKRTRSLEHNVTTSIANTRPKRHSLHVCSQDEEIVIDQFDSEKDALPTDNPQKVALVNLMENEYINAIDNEVRALKTVDKRKRSLRNSNEKVDSNLNVSRGWNRLKAVKKTFAQTEKKSSKLKVVVGNAVNQSQNNLRSKTKKTPAKTVKPVESPVKQKPKSYPLNEIELYFNSKLLNDEDHVKVNDEILQTTPKKHMSEEERIEDKITVAQSGDSGKVAQRNTERASSGGGMEKNESISHPESIRDFMGEHRVAKLTQVKNDTKEHNRPSFEVVVTKAVIENQHLQESHPIEKSVHCTPAPIAEDKCKVQQIDCEEFISNTHPSQTISTNELLREIDNDFIFALPTPTITNSSIINQLGRKLSSISDIVNDHRDDPAPLMYQIRQILNGAPLQPPPAPEMKNTHVQTAVSVDDTCTVGTQFPGFHCKDIGIQTDSFDTSHGFRISSTEMFNLQPVVSSAIQTDPLVCVHCNREATGAFEENNAQRYEFSASFDNLNFDTQDIVLGQQFAMRKGTQNSNSAAQSQASKNFKRIRQPSSGSESDNEKVKANTTKKNKIEHASTIQLLIDTKAKLRRDSPGIRMENNDVSIKHDSAVQLLIDREAELRRCFPEIVLEDNDLSLEFLSDFNMNVREESQKGNNKGPVEPEVIAIKHQPTTEPTAKVVTSVFEEPLPKRVKTQDLLKECEMIIRGACSTTMRIEHTQSSHGSVKLSLDDIADEFNRNFEDGNSNKSSNNPVNNNKHSESIFGTIHNKNSQVKKPTSSAPGETDNNSIVNHLEGLDECFQDDYDPEIELITRPMLKKDENKVHVVQDILIPKQVENGSMTEDIHEIVDSDDEVIESTPQKNRVMAQPLAAVSALSQAYYNPSALEKRPPLLQNNDLMPCETIQPLDADPLTCLNEAFTPPPEFQDPDIEIVESPKHNNVEDVVPNASVTPDLLIHDAELPNENAAFITSTPFSCASQALSLKRLNLSPIRSSHKYVNPILAAQNASRLPLNIIETPSKQRVVSLVTSTPKRKQKSILNYVKQDDTHKENIISQPDLINKKPNVCYTRLSMNEMMHVNSLAKRKLITVSNTYGTSVTHMIVSVDKRNCLEHHTMKYMLAVAAGIWVLSLKWIEECLKQNEIVPEEAYEVLDVTGTDGPHRSRLTRSRAPLLERYKIYAAPPFRSATKMEVEHVIQLLGGDVALRPEDLLNKNGKICLIVTENSESHDEEYEGTEYNAVVEFAPYQEVPNTRLFQGINGCGTICSDIYYQQFLNKIKSDGRDCWENSEYNLQINYVPSLNSATPLLKFITARKAEVKARTERKNINSLVFVNSSVKKSAVSKRRS
ncbi:uncharacterized protein LOC116170478 isoform X2 [Photinus pyralis]|uniref:uncharacterized protein LOC116170478 isoform X2 n=1 Tax=Photinus pyralis TaxID=7054 RepID=UPI0012677146|nr:uncharacterized protein LOC116170478 isoform X2 [Photinus pyralis]